MKVHRKVIVFRFEVYLRSSKRKPVASMRKSVRINQSSTRCPETKFKTMFKPIIS